MAPQARSRTPSSGPRSPQAGLPAGRSSWRIPEGPPAATAPGTSDIGDRTARVHSTSTVSVRLRPRTPVAQGGLGIALEAGTRKIARPLARPSGLAPNGRLRQVPGTLFLRRGAAALSRARRPRSPSARAAREHGGDRPLAGADRVARPPRRRRVAARRCAREQPVGRREPGEHPRLARRGACGQGPEPRGRAAVGGRDPPRFVRACARGLAARERAPRGPPDRVERGERRGLGDPCGGVGPRPDQCRAGDLKPAQRRVAVGLRGARRAGRPRGTSGWPRRVWSARRSPRRRSPCSAA